MARTKPGGEIKAPISASSTQKDERRFLFTFAQSGKALQYESEITHHQARSNKKVFKTSQIGKTQGLRHQVHTPILEPRTV
jgi:hypothetical protein